MRNIGKYIITIMLIMILYGCGKKEDSKDVITNKPLLTEKNAITIEKDFFETFRNASYEKNLLTAKYKLETDCDLMAMGDDYTPYRIKVIKQGTEITVLAQTQRAHEHYGKGYYLVKIDNEDGIWSGWIDRKLINYRFNAKMPFFLMYSGFINISNDNEIMALVTEWQGSIIIVKRSGDVIANISLKEIQKKKKDAVDGGTIGWSTGNKYVWFETSLDSVIACYIRINTISGEYEIIDRPNHFADNQIKINYDTGDCLYSDYPYQFDTDTAAETKKGGHRFTLYKGNLFQRRYKAIAFNYGEGFDIIKNKDGDFLYRLNGNTIYTIIK